MMTKSKGAAASPSSWSAERRGWALKHLKKPTIKLVVFTQKDQVAIGKLNLEELRQAEIHRHFKLSITHYN